ncbi:MAG: stage III sporulation AC/AD family protein [Clostridia bacterium]
MILQIISLGLIVAILSSILKQYNQQYVILLEIGTACIVAVYVFNLCVDELSYVFDYLENDSTATELFEILLKGTIICIVTKLAADICKENGNMLISDIIELCGRIVIVLLSLPLLESVIKIAISYAS